MSVIRMIIGHLPGKKLKIDATGPGEIPDFMPEQFRYLVKKILNPRGSAGRFNYINKF